MNSHSANGWNFESSNDVWGDYSSFSISCCYSSIPPSNPIHKMKMKTWIETKAINTSCCCCLVFCVERLYFYKCDAASGGPFGNFVFQMNVAE